MKSSESGCFREPCAEVQQQIYRHGVIPHATLLADTLFAEKAQVVMKEILLRISITSISILVCFVLAELVGRQSLSYVARKSVSQLGGSLEADPELLVEYTARGRRMVPNADVVIHNHYISGLDVDIKTNTLGLRDPERSAQPDPGNDRIIMLGDSIIVQDYLPSDSTLVRIMERSLSNSDGNKIEIVNAALSNLGIDEEYQLLSDIIDKIRPTAVLLSFYLNDSRPAWGFSGEIGNKRGWFRKHSIVIDTIVRELEVRKWLDKSKVDRFAWKSLLDTTPWKTDPQAFRALAAAAPFDWGSAWNEDSWSTVERGVQKIQELTQRHGARLGVVIMPVKYQVVADFKDDLPQQRAGAILSRLGIPYMSLLDLEREYRTEDIFYDWCHPNERGNEIIAPAIENFIQKNLRIGKK